MIIDPVDLRPETEIEVNVVGSYWTRAILVAMVDVDGERRPLVVSKQDAEDYLNMKPLASLGLRIADKWRPVS